jgi:hypothetical protein
MQQLSIEKPCSEKWNKMIPLDEGRLCQVCNTPVIDFTQKSEREILDYFEKKNGEHICGKYAASTVSTPRSARFKWLLIALTFVFGIGLVSSCRRHVQGKRKLPVDKKAKRETSHPNSHGRSSH